ncbi:MAG: SDR family NAD(P)-dependent oxidoreductase [Bacteroidales bacterium]|nr:SDR family NAD(P)-dependent oxidoreductase [Bacteroidales bacterium]
MDTKKWLNRFQEAHGRRPWALITGGSSGMGLEYARQLSEIGCNLLLVSNQKEELEKVSEDLKRNTTLQIVPHYQDLATESAAVELFGFCQAEGFQIDITSTTQGCSFSRN